MPEEFLNLSIETKRAILEGVETKLGIKPYLLEKDIWICWTLKELFSLPQKMAFKGGTSLSKCYELIDRFSEDVDVTVDYREFMPNLDLLNESKNSLKNKREKLKEEVKAYITSIVIPMLEKAFSLQFGNANFNYRFEDGEKLYFDYPSVFEKSFKGYVKDNILIEFGGTNKTEPNEVRIVKPYLNMENLIFPLAEVSVYSPMRTFWEKVTLIHVECHRGRLKESPERLSRHWYDLAKLSQSYVKSIALEDKTLLNDVLMVKKAFFNASYANYDKCENKQFQLMPKQSEITYLKADYAKMIESDMFLNNPVAFDEILRELEELQDTLNKN